MYIERIYNKKALLGDNSSEFCKNEGQCLTVAMFSPLWVQQQMVKKGHKNSTGLTDTRLGFKSCSEFSL